MGNVTTLCQECGLAALCDVIVDSAQVGVSKPEQRIFTLALAQLGRTAQTAVYVGDSFERDVLGIERLDYTPSGYAAWSRASVLIRPWSMPPSRRWQSCQLSWP